MVQRTSRNATASLDEVMLNSLQIGTARLERRARSVEVCVLGALPLVVEYGGIVDEHVQFTELFFDHELRVINTLLLGYVQLNGDDLKGRLNFLYSGR